MYESINKAREPAADDVKMEVENSASFVKAKSFGKPDEEILYDLVGIVVHSGQANAGHYYSFIKGNFSDK